MCFSWSLFIYQKKCRSHLISTYTLYETSIKNVCRFLKNNDWGSYPLSDRVESSITELPHLFVGPIPSIYPVVLPAIHYYHWLSDLASDKNALFNVSWNWLFRTYQYRFNSTAKNRRADSIGVSKIWNFRFCSSSSIPII